MFEQLKNAVGLGTPAEEMWNCNPLAIIDDADELIWREPATIRYVPGREKYEGGVGIVLNPDTEEPIVQFTLLDIQHRDALGIPFPLGALLPWGESGVTVSAVDSQGRHLMLHSGSHAVSYLQNRAGGGEPVEAPPVD